MHGTGPRSVHRRHRSSRLRDRPRPRFRFKDVEHRPSVVQFEHETGTADTAAPDGHVPELVEGGLELELRLSAGPSTDPAPTDAGFEDDPEVRQVEDPGPLRWVVRPVASTGHGVGASEHALPGAQKHQGENRAGNLIPSPPRASARRPRTQLFAEPLRRPLGGDGDRHRCETPYLSSEEPLGPGAVLLPALSKPGAHGPLHPAFRVVQKTLEEIERPVEFARSDPRSQRVRRCASPPEILGAGPAQKFPETLRLGRDRAREGSRGEGVRKGPTGGPVHPPGSEPPGERAVGHRRPREELERDQSLLEPASPAERANERPRLGGGHRLDTTRGRARDPPKGGGPDSEHRHGRTEIGAERLVLGGPTTHPELSQDPTAFRHHPSGWGPPRSYHPTGLSRFCSSSHRLSGAKYSRSAVVSIRRSPVSASSASGHSRLIPISSAVFNRLPAGFEP